MSSTRASNKRSKETSAGENLAGSDKKKQRPRDQDPDDDSDPDLDISTDLKGIISALHCIREKAQDGQKKKSEEIIGSVASEVRNVIDDAKSKADKDRQSFLKALLKISKECESLLKNEYSNFEAAYNQFTKDKAASLQSFKDMFTKFENEKEKLIAKYEQQRKKEKANLSEIEKICKQKIADAEASIKKKQQDDKSFSILRKSLGSFLDDGSDDESGRLILTP